MFEIQRYVLFVSKFHVNDVQRNVQSDDVIDVTRRLWKNKDFEWKISQSWNKRRCVTTKKHDHNDEWLNEYDEIVLE